MSLSIATVGDFRHNSHQYFLVKLMCLEFVTKSNPVRLFSILATGFIITVIFRNNSIGGGGGSGGSGGSGSDGSMYF